MPRGRTILATAGAALLGAAGWYLLAKRSHDDRAAIGRTSRASRTTEMASIVARAGRDTALHKARLRVVSDPARRAEMEEQFQLRTAAQVAESLGQMKGALMKLGQMASYIDQGLGGPARDAFAQLQASAPPMAPELAMETVERELGRSLEDVFAEWDAEPLASASIGQVHRAVLRDGRVVAVKVQYPGVDEAIRSDLANTDLIVAGVGMIFPGLDPKPLVEELETRLTEELDYRLEAENQRLFGEFYRDHPFIRIPAVVGELSTARVLTTELSDGERFDVAHSWSQDQRNLAAEAIYRFVFRSLWHLHAFNGDPHPGNYLLHGDGKVTFLDFGLVKRFQPSDLEPLHSMLQAYVFDHDHDRFRDEIIRAGFLVPGAKVSDEILVEYNGHWYDYVYEPKEYTITPEWSSEALRRYFVPTGPFGDAMKQMNVPKQYVILQRINLGLFAVLGELRATRNWRRIVEEIWPWVSGPPSTELGELEARWLRDTGRHAAWDE